MTKQEIDRRLALAIGYPAKRVRNIHGYVQVWNDKSLVGWQRFDHLAPDVIWPIAQVFNSFPKWQYNGSCEFIGWHCWAMCRGYGAHSNPATASALAVIRFVEGKQ